MALQDNEKLNRELAAKRAAQSGRPTPTLDRATQAAQGAAATTARAASPAVGVAESVAGTGGAFSKDGAFSALRPGITARERGADVRQGLGNIASDIGNTVGNAYNAANNAVSATANAVLRPVGDAIVGLATGSGTPSQVPVAAPVAAVAGGANQLPERPQSTVRQSKFGAVPRPQQPAPAAPAAPAPTPPPAPPAPAPASAAPVVPQRPIAEAMQNPAANTFVGTKTGIRTLNPDGGVTPTNRPGESGQVGSFNVVPAAAISRPGIGTMGVAAGREWGASQAPGQYRAQVANAQARNQATRDRIASGGIPRMAAEGTFRPGTGAALGSSAGPNGEPSERAQLDAMRSQFNAQGREQIAGREQAATDVAGRAQVAAQGEAGANSRLQQQLASQQSEGAANRAAGLQRPTQPITLQDGTLAMLDPNTNRLTPVTGADGKPARPQSGSALDPNKLVSAYAQQAAAIEQGIGDRAEKDAALAMLQSDPLYAPLFGQQRGTSAPPADAVGMLRANPELAADFDAKYGPGAAAGILGN